jgi:hypothetical protein
VLCPRCNPGGGGKICRKFVAELGLDVYLCDECDAMWLSTEAVYSEPFQDYSTYMRARGVEPSWEGLLPVVVITS